MAVPRILIAVALISAGAFIPAASSVDVDAPAGTVGMSHEGFTTDELHIHTGDTVKFVNNSHYMHIIGPGRDGTIATVDKNPLDDRVLMPSNDTYTTPTFNTPGTYFITCSMHPDMTTKIVVSN